MSRILSFTQDFIATVLNFGLPATAFSLLMAGAGALDMIRYGYDPFNTARFIFIACESVFLIVAIRSSAVHAR